MPGCARSALSPGLRTAVGAVIRSASVGTGNQRLAPLTVRGNKMAQFGVDVGNIGDRICHCRAQVPGKAAAQPMQNHGEALAGLAQARRGLGLTGSAAFD